jgi:hypothetical protein
MSEKNIYHQLIFYDLFRVLLLGVSITRSISLLLVQKILSLMELLMNYVKLELNVLDHQNKEPELKLIKIGQKIS